MIRTATNLKAELIIKGWEGRLASTEGPHKLYRSWC